MTLQLKITLLPDGQKYLAALAQAAGDQKTLYAALMGVMQKLALKAAGHVVKTQLSGQVLRRRTGSLASSIVGTAFYGGRGVPGFRVGVMRGPALRYAGVLEFGTQGKNPSSPYSTIVPVRARYLAMPVGEALTGAGVARYPSPRDFPGRLTFIPFRSSGIAAGALYDSETLKKGPDGRIDFEAARKLWVLLRRLDLPAYHYMLKGLRAFLPAAASELQAFLADVLRQPEKHIG